jgi:CRP/FNR family transcriptional regulator, cyclic AMP receptor protein
MVRRKWMPAQFCAVTFVTPQGQNHAIGDALGYSSLIDPSEGLARMARSPVTQANWSLAGITIFADLSGKALARVQQCCSWRRYQPGESIVGYLDSSDDVFFVISGEVRVTIYSLVGKAVSFRELGPGEVFGEYPAIDRGPRSASVEARKTSIVATLPGAAFRELIRSEPVVAQALLPHLVMKIRALTARVYEFSTLAVSNRIQAELLRLARLAEPGGKSARIAPAPTHTEIASRVSTHREAVTREFARLSRVGLIEREGSALLVKDVERLAEMVHAATGE